MLTIEKKKERKSKSKSKAASLPLPPSISSRSPIPYTLAYNTILQHPLSTLYSTLYSLLQHPSLLLYRHSQSSQVTSSRSIQSSQINEIETCLGESQGCFGISERKGERARNHKQPQSEPRSRTLSISNFNRKARTTKRRRRRRRTNSLWNRQ